MRVKVEADVGGSKLMLDEFRVLKVPSCQGLI